MFYGEAGIGKFESALNYAKAMLCEKNNGTYCNECKHCKLIDSYKHPDVIVISTDEKFLNAEFCYNQFVKYNLSHLFNDFYSAVRSLLYKLESGLFKSYDNYPQSAPEQYIIGSRRDTSRDTLMEPYYLAVNLTLNELNEKNAYTLHSIYNSKAKEALEIAKNKGGKRKNLTIEGDFFDALKKLHYNVIHTVISLDTIRNIIELTYKKPSIGRKRVIIIEGLELMDGKAPNIFLRTLEEPTDNNIFILISSNTEKLTQEGIKPLRSRLMEVAFTPLSQVTLNSILQKRFRLDLDIILKVLPYSEGSAGNAIKYILRERLTDTTTLDKNANTSDNIERLLYSLLNALINKDVSKYSLVSTEIINGGYDGAEIIKRFCKMFADFIKSRHTNNEHFLKEIIPTALEDENIMWFIDEMDRTARVLLITNAQEKIALRKTLSDMYMWFNN